MQKIILRYGLWSAAMAGLFLLGMTLFMRSTENYNGSMVVGFAGIILSLLFVYFGIRNYRDGEGGGYISFGRAFQVGIAIAVIGCLGYVLTWMVVWKTLVPDFADRYGAAVLSSLEQKGAAATEIQAKREEVEQMRTWYESPLKVAALTFLEPFPVALLMTLISALVLRRTAPAAESLR